MVWLKANLLVLLVSLSIKQSSCICKKSYQTICDSVSEFEKFNDGTWSDVVIKSDPRFPSKKVPFNVKPFRTLTSLTLVDQINRLDDTENTCVYDIKLKSLNFYANSIKSVRPGNFLRFLNLQKLGLVNNEIETLHRGAFSLPQIEIIDLSANKLEKIESGVFTNDQAKGRSKTRVIILKDNKLKNIEPNSFPPYLEILKLENNNLQTLRNGTVNDLAYLQGLYLSNNQLFSFPNLTGLFTLKVLDLSRNNIKTVNGEGLDGLKYLQILDLSQNKITSVNFLKPLLMKHERLEIFMNFNNLQSLDGLDMNGTLTDKTLDLYGNPWLCEKWPSIESRLRDINLKRSKCDLDAFSNNNVPFCQDSYSLPLEEHVKVFYDNVVTKGHQLKCDYVDKSYENLFYKKSVDIRCSGG